MNNTSRIIILSGLSFLLCYGSVGAQRNNFSDSLLKQLNKAGTTDIQRAKLFAELSWIVMSDNHSQGIGYASQALQLGRQSRDPTCLSYVFSYLASAYGRLDSMTLAKHFTDSALIYAKKTDNKLVKGLALCRQGWLQNINNDIDGAVKSWQQALDCLEGLPDGARTRAGIYYQYFGIYSERGDTAKEQYYAHETLKEAQAPAATDLLSPAWQINGTACLDIYDLSKDSTLLDSALTDFKKAISSSVQPATRNIAALSALYIAQIYMDHFPPWIKDSVIKYVNIALAEADTVSNGRMVINCYTILSHYALQEGKTDQAEQLLQRANGSFMRLQPTDYFVGENLYKAMANVAEKKGDLSQSLKYYKLYTEYFKKEFDARQFETTQRLEARYQAEKKEKEIQLLRQQEIFHQKQNYFYLGIIAVAVLGSIFMFLAYHFRLRYSLQREKLLKGEKEEAHLQSKLKEEEAAHLEMEKHEAELQSRLRAEEAARLQAEQQLLKTQQEQLQKELLTGALQIEHKNALLQTLKEKLSMQQDTQNAVRQLEKIINEENRLDEDFEKLKLEFKDLHPEFFNRLQQQANNKLTALDLKYCAYIYTNLSNKQIASLMHVESKSVRMVRYRLKQKLNLLKEETLDNYLKNFG